MALDLRGGASSGGGGASSNPYLYKATNYTDLVTTYPSANNGDLAYVYNSQGTAWLPFTLGGTYYPNGVYVWSGTAWVSDRNAIANELQNLIDEKLDKPTVTTVAGSSYTVLATDSIINITSTTCTITFPDALLLDDFKEFTLFFTDCNLTIQRTGTNYIDNQISWTLQNSGSFNVQKIDSNNYRIS